MKAKFPVISFINPDRSPKTAVEKFDGYNQLVATDPDGNIIVFVEYTTN